MNAVFADTFYFIALINSRDKAHARAVAFSQKQKIPVFTTAWVLTEVANTFTRPPERSLAIGLFKAVESNSLFTVIPPDLTLFRQGFQLYASRPDKSWSLTDCISFVVMRQHGITDALTGDHHFEQAGFNALLRKQ